MVEGMIEIILFAQDMQRQVSFYRDVIGLPVTYPAGKADYSAEYWVTLDGGGCILALHGGGQGRTGPDAPKLVFKVADMAAARQELTGHGVALTEVRNPAPGVHVCDGKDPEGNSFSIEMHG